MTEQVIHAVHGAGQPIEEDHFAEWVALALCDWDEVDRFLLDFETNGGG